MLKNICRLLLPLMLIMVASVQAVDVPALIAKPVVFVDQNFIQSEQGCQECKELHKKIAKMRDEYAREADLLNSQLLALQNKYNAEGVNNKDGSLKAEFIKDRQRQAEINAKMQELTDALNQEGSRLWVDMPDKIEKAIKAIAKQLGACGTVSRCFDPAYDITQRVIDYLDEQYLSKGEKRIKVSCHSAAVLARIQKLLQENGIDDSQLSITVN